MVDLMANSAAFIVTQAHLHAAVTTVYRGLEHSPALRKPQAEGQAYATGSPTQLADLPAHGLRNPPGLSQRQSLNKCLETWLWVDTIIRLRTPVPAHPARTAYVRAHSAWATQCNEALGIQRPQRIQTRRLLRMAAHIVKSKLLADTMSYGILLRSASLESIRSKRGLARGALSVRRI